MKLMTTFTYMLISIFAVGQTQKDSVEFSVTFSACFENDIVSFSINKLRVFENVKIFTIDRSIDISNVGAYQTDKYLFVVIDSQKKKLPKIRIGDTMVFDILLNHVSQHFKLSLKNGNNIFIDNCSPTTPFKTKDNLHISQHKGMVYLD